MREFSLLDVIKYYLKKIWIVGVATLFTFLIGYFYTDEYFKPTYEESATIILGKSNNSESESEISYSTITLYDSLIKNYLELLESNKLFYDVKENLKLDYSVSEISKMVEYSVADTSQVMTITVKNASDKLAVKICNEIIDVLKDYVYDVYGLDNITVIDKAVETGNLVIQKNMIIFCFIILGVVTSSFIIVLKYIFSNRLSEDDSKDNLNVLGNVRLIINNKNHSLNSEISIDEINRFRNIRAKLIKRINNSKVIMISSINKCKLKSYVTYNLAQAFRMIDKNVLVIDANDKDGLITDTFLKDKKGLLDVMHNHTSAKEVINSVNDIDIISLGNKEWIDLISSNHFKELIDEMKDKYDYIFVESPSFKNNFEPYSIMKLTEATIMVGSHSINAHDLEIISDELAKFKNIFLGMVFVCLKKKIIIKVRKNKTIKKEHKDKKVKLFEFLKKKKTVKSLDLKGGKKKDDKKSSAETTANVKAKSSSKTNKTSETSTKVKRSSSKKTSTSKEKKISSKNTKVKAKKS